MGVIGSLWQWQYVPEPHAEYEASMKQTWQRREYTVNVVGNSLEDGTGRVITARWGVILLPAYLLVIASGYNKFCRLNRKSFVENEKGPVQLEIKKQDSEVLEVDVAGTWSIMYNASNLKNFIQ